MDKLLNEFRQDLVSGDLVLLASGRAKRPNHDINKKDFYQPKEGCPFENLKNSGQEIVWGYPENENWRAMVIKNKFPALKPGLCGPNKKIGPFNSNDATGSHDIIVFRDHDLLFSDFSKEQMVDGY